jgi:hypothetical protein
MMNSVPSSTSAKRLRRIVFVIIFLILGTLLFLSLSSSRSKLEWLTPGQLAQTTRPGKFALLKRKFFTLTAPLWSWYHPHHSQVAIDSILLRTSLPSAIETNLGAPISTNSDGMRVWIVSAIDFAPLKKQLPTSPGTDAFLRRPMQAPDGMAVNALGPITEDPRWYFTVRPEISSSNVKLDLGVSIKSAPKPTADSPPPVGLHVVVPNGGAIVIDYGRKNDFNGRSHWVFMSPTIVDANGNPIKP